LTLTHLTTNTGHTRLSPRAEVSNEIIAMLKPVLARGGGEIKGLHIVLHPRDRDGRTAFDIGWERGAPDVSCVLTCDAPGEWTLTATILPHALTLGVELLGMLGDAERCVAWALLESATERPK
jgi:hypothetical protein